MTPGGLPLPSTPERRQESTNLADILDRILDKGIVIAGDIREPARHQAAHDQDPAARGVGRGRRGRSASTGGNTTRR